MGKIIVMNGVTLDGVIQSPGRPDEDTRDAFQYGGVPYSDDATVAKMGERMGTDRAFLFGRRTYEELLSSWNAQGGPFKDPSTTLTVRRLKQPRGKARLAQLNTAARRGPGCRGGPQAELGRKSRDHGQRRADRLADGRRPRFDESNRDTPQVATLGLGLTRCAAVPPHRR
jgi:hypothetical protein